jgi:Zn-dependent protease
MFGEKISIAVSVLILSLIFSYLDISKLPLFLAIFAVIILVNVVAKKITAHYLEVNSSVHIWDFRQYWFAESWKFARPAPIGLLLPPILIVFTYGAIKWLGMLQTEFEAKLTKLIRKRKPWSYPGLRNLDVSLILLAGFLANIILALLAVKLSPQLAALTLLYCFYNLIPIGKLDGFQLLVNNRALYVLTVMLLAVAAGVFLVLQI